MRRLGELALNLLFRARFAILGLALALTIFAVFWQWRVAPAECLHDLQHLAAAMLLAAAIAWLQFRHAALAMVAAAAPIPGLAASAFLVEDGCKAIVDGAVLAYPFGFACAALLLDDFSMRLGQGSTARQITSAALWASSAFVVLATAMVLAAIVPFAIVSGGYPLVLVVLAAALSSLVLAPVSGSVLTLNDDFVTRANRSQELFRRAAERLAPMVQRRWAFSFVGIAIVLSVLGAFGAQTFFEKVGWRQVGWTAAGAVALWLASLALMRDWRRATAAILSAAAAVLFALWLASGLRQPLSPDFAVVFFGACAIGFAIAALFGAEAAGRARNGHDPPTSWLAAFERRGHALAFATMGAAVAALPLAGDPLIAASLLLSSLCQMVFQPAWSIALEAVFPRRGSLEARYRL